MGYYSIVCAYPILFNYSFAGGHLGFFPHIGAVVNNAAVNIAMQNLCIYFIWVYN